MTQSTLNRDATTRRRFRRPALLWAALSGVLADSLLRAPGRPGLNLVLWAFIGVTGIAMLLHLRDGVLDRETGWLLGGAFALAATLALRDAEATAFFCIMAATLLLVLAAGRAGTAWVTRAQISDIVFTCVSVGLLCAAGPLGWGRHAGDSLEGARQWTRCLRTVLRGVALALPALLVVNALLMSADPVYSRIITTFFQVDIQKILDHAIVITLIAWGTAGFLRALLSRNSLADRWRVPNPGFAAAEVTVALWLLNVLFIGFMAVQLRYLFGGASLVTVTGGLTYAEYARNGFFELIDTAALVLPILLVADWASVPDSVRARAVLRAAMLVLVLLLMGVIASAAYRIHLYQEAYGMTEQRLYVSVFIVWLLVVLSWLVATVLRGQRERFAWGAIGAGLTCLVVLTLFNPHALIARVNLDRARDGKSVDPEYLLALSADAVPAILARLDSLPEVERCHVGQLLVDRWGGVRPGGWRTWNLGDARARTLISGRAGSLICPSNRPVA